ncbi:NAD(P)/FAD-dependent oxidoreductase [Methylovirgula sp. 4M-Z18]|uniref:NAD(P)/FAD-dependent oxidoreductase n=1 Tax=Methylovirgula sp. 4M-Z18 TaxID=2293567 RepID=UPI000E2FA538|nr:FAD-dependent oxidoreductase [Methylovirgula sp. 4M-Z18]RFB79864.1 NAD(P)/FAD-dependent oxidoreductase [Methylovirgula sp. 4M-Z18]
MKERLLIVGHGMASVRLCEDLMTFAPDRFDVTIVGAEPRLAYNRVLLSALLAGEVAESDLTLRPSDWYAQHGVRVISGQRVTGLDLGGRTAALENGTSVAFDRVVLATGSVAARLPIPGMDLPGVMTFRDFADMPGLSDAAARGARVAVVGGGLLGIEAACSLAKGGAKVTLVHVMDRLMERQLDPRSAAFLKRAVERKGVQVLLNAQTVAVGGSTKAESLRFADGSELHVDLVVVAIGVRPNVALAQTADLPVKRGILIDDQMTTVVPFVHALGECAEHRGTVYGLVEPAYDQARVLARLWAGNADARYEGTILATNLKVSGIPVFSAGDFLGQETTQDIVFEDRGAGQCRKLVVKDNRLVGAALVGEASDALWYRDLIRRGEDISALRHNILFGRTLCEQGAP